MRRKKTNDNEGNLNAPTNETSIIKIFDNSHQILFKNFINLGKSKIYYNSYYCKNMKVSNNHFISITGNKIEYYSFVNIKRNIEMKKNITN